MRQGGGAQQERGCAVESVVAQICREGGARVSTNVMVREHRFAQVGGDCRRYLPLEECN